MRKIDKIVIHHSVTPRDLSLNKSISSFDRTHKARLHKEKNSKWYHIAYHFVIWWDGKYIATRGLGEIWYHASNLAINQTSVWICLTWNFDSDEPTSAQYNSLKKLINLLQSELGKLTIHGHNEFSSKSCPWKNFNFAKLNEMLFYEKLRRDNHESTPKENRMFKDPDAFIERLKDMSDADKFREMSFLIALMAEKTWNIKRD